MSTRIQAAGLLSLLLAGLASGWVLPHQVRAHRAWVRLGGRDHRRARPWEGSAEGSRRPLSTGQSSGQGRGVQSRGPEYQGLEAPNELHHEWCVCSVFSPSLDSGEHTGNKVDERSSALTDLTSQSGN